MEFLTIQQFRNDSDEVFKPYRNVTIFNGDVYDYMDMIYSNAYLAANRGNNDFNLRPRKLRYNINKRKWNV